MLKKISKCALDRNIVFIVNISIFIFNISLNLADCYRTILVALYFTVRVLTCTNSILTCGALHGMR